MPLLPPSSPPSYVQVSGLFPEIWVKDTHFTHTNRNSLLPDSLCVHDAQPREGDSGDYWRLSRRVDLHQQQQQQEQEQTSTEIDMNCYREAALGAVLKLRGGWDKPPAPIQGGIARFGPTGPPRGPPPQRTRPSPQSKVSPNKPSKPPSPVIRTVTPPPPDPIEIATRFLYDVVYSPRLCADGQFWGTFSRLAIADEPFAYSVSVAPLVKAARAGDSQREGDGGASRQAAPAPAPGPGPAASRPPPTASRGPPSASRAPPGPGNRARGPSGARSSESEKRTGDVEVTSNDSEAQAWTPFDCFFEDDASGRRSRGAPPEGWPASGKIVAEFWTADERRDLEVLHATYTQWNVQFGGDGSLIEPPTRLYSFSTDTPMVTLHVPPIG
jgi:hypothetical protein